MVVNNFSNKLLIEFVKLRRRKPDYLYLRLNHKVGVCLMFLYMFYYKFYWTSHISCMGSEKNNNEHILDMVKEFCWVTGTFTVTNLDPEKQLYPGIGQQTPTSTAYYQYNYKWTYLAAYCSLFLICIPHFAWNYLEDRRLKRLCVNLSGIGIFGSDTDTYKTEKDKLVYYLRTHLGRHTRYATYFLFCGFLNVVAAALTMVLWNLTADNSMLKSDVTLNTVFRKPFERNDSLYWAFPYLSKCIFKNFGPGGGVQTHDFMCVISVNAWNQRAAMAFWYFFMFVVMVTLAGLTMHFGTIFSKRLRVYFLSDLSSLASVEDLQLVCEKCSYGDWFIVYQIGRELDPAIFREIIEQFAGKLRAPPQRFAFTSSSATYRRRYQVRA